MVLCFNSYVKCIKYFRSSSSASLRSGSDRGLRNRFIDDVYRGPSRTEGRRPHSTRTEAHIARDRILSTSLTLILQESSEDSTYEDEEEYVEKVIKIDEISQASSGEDCDKEKGAFKG